MYLSPIHLGKIHGALGPRTVLSVGGAWYGLPPISQGGPDLTPFLHAVHPDQAVQDVLGTAEPLDVRSANWLPPLDRHEVWAAGVTYRRSETARREESHGAARFYDAVYRAERPELFFKATPHRVVGHQQLIRLRRDARWNVPEPELTLALNPQLQIVGYTLGNDVSSRDIEGENPLYLPQAKIYDGSCALGPYLTLANPQLDPRQWRIHLKIARGQQVCFSGSSAVADMARQLTELVAWLGRECSFPEGCLLLTGTGIVPPSDFTLQSGDVVEMEAEPLGKLVNTVA
jgi:2-dehydro-3-deoxy-D-arabinonate dehydratase